ncbi:YkgJ family cysteine cluster protein [Lysinibacillus sp. ZYM-1]|uniref:YkgJ family cysteine cluster protein n=1 Tax=Lysinibacillus sp. ZYM-1 TaxID=1681184 RepID=UPI0006CE8FFB|nr:YkgJ family cysteine cluster protein [Lysinibacillus sp. ZYM-1]KPN96485.1 Fe-S oxidoreductase [Lysinibacillus sp. ZYM-1]
MGKLPCEGCKGLCCGPVPITENELKNIKKRLKSMPTKLRIELKNQQRFVGTCIFYDMQKDRCGIHSARPEICRMFGYYQELVCFRNPVVATKTMKTSTFEKHIGILSIDYMWKDFD